MKFILLDSAATGSFFIGLIFFAILFVIAVFVTRWIFGINKILSEMKYQSYQLALLNKLICKMAQNKTLSDEELDKIIEATNQQHPD